jgi:hypothetical protein
MTARNGNHRRRGRVVAEKVPAILREAFVHALEVTELTDARAASDMDVDVSTVERYKQGHKQGKPVVHVVHAKHVLRSKRLWRPFWLCVGKLMHRAWRAA